MPNILNINGKFLSVIYFNSNPHFLYNLIATSLLFKNLMYIFLNPFYFPYQMACQHNLQPTPLPLYYFFTDNLYNSQSPSLLSKLIAINPINPINSLLFQFMAKKNRFFSLLLQYSLIFFKSAFKIHSEQRLNYLSINFGEIQNMYTTNNISVQKNPIKYIKIGNNIIRLYFQAFKKKLNSFVG
ncbi:hypothetical protein IMG5_030550 [Ichthyophthirius multifiliis]|uniref:Uncharacterized protein n=1 Tax=Ichthyophthirius multifiliis TaxID=5932 RepID=G0QLH4_ICHMU|nr:hypothetical protein IMG5_030550 [Ichthyophthirius multifiliis]EGR33930.1 hypothetical protein IMG5_030550 [Ichthyophthirius multifiliis]|eukprot:XP_004039234.1 hypothetical protein IMG5_030550 [Ichthyophthirius multifiliis]